MKPQSNFTIRKKEDLSEAVNQFGFLPFFANPIPGFSIEEHIDSRIWFTEEEGPWEWKGPVIRELGCAYGKFFEKKAAFISKEWFPDFANYRRDGYDFDTIITRLQSQCYVLISDFIYLTNKRGEQYGWGVAEYSTPERFMGSNFTEYVYDKSPEESYEKVFTHLKTLLPGVDEAVIKKFLK